MSTSRRPVTTGVTGLVAHGYGWLPNLRRRSGAQAVRFRLAGQRVLALSGPDAVRFFYDDNHIRRAGALPEPVQSTLFGRGAVHTLDGELHRHRKAMFMSLMTGEGVDRLVGHATTAWDEVFDPGRRGSAVVLFDEAARILTRAVCRWAGVPLAPGDVAPLAADLVALVDGFGTLGPRHWRARRARQRRERWLADLVDQVRDGALDVPGESACAAVARHRATNGELLPPRVAAVELLNVIRPTVAVCWYVMFAAHALHRWPAQRARLRAGDPGYAEAFAHEVRRFYPFAPFVGGRAVTDLTWQGESVPAGALVLLDLYGQNHDPQLWPEPYVFDPTRFHDREPGAVDLVPQGGGSPYTGHRCPGEAITVALLAAFADRLARLGYVVPEQDLDIPLHRIPTRVRSGFVLVLQAGEE